MLSARLLVFVYLFGFSANEDATVPESATNTPQVMTESSELVTSTPVTEVTTLAVTDADSDPNVDHPDAENGLEEPRLLPDFVDASDVICTVCNCTDNAVDCKNRDLHRPFHIDDWIGIQKLGLQDISNVDLSGNHFVLLPQLPALPIKRLNLSQCEIEILNDGAFSKLKYLTILDLSRNKMSNALVTGKRVFMGVLTNGTRPSPFEYLKHLSLAYNELHSLSQGVFTYMPYLTYLDLSGNSLVTIDQVTMGSLGDVMILKELRISECDLETLPTGIFRRLRRLQRLDLSGNRFTEVPKVLSEAVNLQYLNLNGNPIQAISERTAISDLRKLQELHLSRLSKLRSINRGALEGLESLIKLHMSYNPRLTDLDPKFMEWEDDLGVEKWPLLEELYLNNNNISGIDSRFLERWDYLTHVDFSANPYACNCNNQWMVKVLVPLIMRMANASTAKMICRRPYDYRGLSFAQLYEFRKTLPCPESEGVTEASSPETAVLYGVLVGILIAFPLVMVVVLLWKKGFFTKCRKKMTSKHDYYNDEETDAF